MSSLLDLAVREQLANYLDGELALDEFKDWLVPLVWDAEPDADPDAVRLARRIHHRLAEQSSGYVTEDDLRRLLRPMLEPAAVPAAS